MTHPTRDALDEAIANAERGHRPSEWEDAATQLASAARAYTEHVDAKRAEWEHLSMERLLDESGWEAAVVSRIEARTPHGNNIIRELVPEWVLHFIRKSNDYGDTANHLGAAGQYADMHRKMGKLKRALWDGEALTEESPREILLDLIGHCFLTIHYIDNGDKGR